MAHLQPLNKLVIIRVMCNVILLSLSLQMYQVHQIMIIIIKYKASQNIKIM